MALAQLGSIPRGAPEQDGRVAALRIVGVAPEAAVLKVDTTRRISVMVVGGAEALDLDPGARTIRESDPEGVVEVAGAHARPPRRRARLDGGSGSPKSGSPLSPPRD